MHPVAGRACLALALLVLATTLSAQRRPETAPRVGQPGKDILWVPSPNAMVDGMLSMAMVTPRDFVMDLGSGDGRLVLAAAKRGAQAVGIEYDSELVELSKRNAAALGLTDKATFLKADLFTADLSKATVVLMFLRLDLNLRLRPKLLELKPGTRVVSNTFAMGDWEPDDIALIRGDCVDLCTALLWIVPAQVPGTWRSPQGDLTLTQRFQRVSGIIRTGAVGTSISEGRLHGDEIALTAGAARYRGRVSGKSIEGTVSVGGTTKRWTARRPELGN